MVVGNKFDMRVKVSYSVEIPQHRRRILFYTLGGHDAHVDQLGGSHEIHKIGEHLVLAILGGMRTP